MSASRIIGLLVIASLSAGCRTPPEDLKVPCYEQSAYFGHIARGSAPETNSVITVVVDGEIHHPGPVQVPRGSTILDAIKQAGGFTDFAHARRIVVERAGSRIGFMLRREEMGVGFCNHYRVWYVPSRSNLNPHRDEPVDTTVKTDAVLEPGDRIWVPRAML
jgi:protein involved in polysaccharide export with SLBB domain